MVCCKVVLICVLNGAARLVQGGRRERAQLPGSHFQQGSDLFCARGLMSCAPAAGWTAVPGVLMEAGGGGAPGCQVLSVAARRLEFVVSNGGHDWCAKANPCDCCLSGRLSLRAPACGKAVLLALAGRSHKLQDLCQAACSTICHGDVCAFAGTPRTPTAAAGRTTLSTRRGATGSSPAASHGWAERARRHTGRAPCAAPGPGGAGGSKRVQGVQLCTNRQKISRGTFCLPDIYGGRRTTAQKKQGG